MLLTHWHENKKPMLVITFDDGNSSDFSIAFAEMRKRGITGVSYVHTNSKSLTHVMPFMISKNWDIQCHSETHTKFADLTEQQVIDELIANNAYRESIGLPVPEHLAYPYGSTGGYLYAVSQMRLTATVTTGGIMKLEERDVNRASLFRLNGAVVTDEEMNDLKTTLDTLEKTPHGVLIMMFHAISRLESGGNGTTVWKERFTEFIDYALSKAIRFATISEMWEEKQDHFYSPQEN